MTTQERQDKEKKLNNLKREMVNLKGTPCEVYSRVVGYLRPVQSWNKGKKEEFSVRKTFEKSLCSCD